MGFATDSDYELCRQIHQRYGATYYFASQRFNRELRRRVHAVYGFVRVADEFVDNPGALSQEERFDCLKHWREGFLKGVKGECPGHPALRAFCDVARETSIPEQEPLMFLDAMESDLTVSRYETYERLESYMRGSAASVGVMLCYAFNAEVTAELSCAAMALGKAMQLTNFLRDIREDGQRGRIYIPLEDLEQFRVSESQILEGALSESFSEMLAFEIKRARDLYQKADEGIPLLPLGARRPVRLARILYARILDRIEARNYDVFSRRASTSKVEKLATAAKILLFSRA